MSEQPEPQALQTVDARWIQSRRFPLLVSSVSPWEVARELETKEAEMSISGHAHTLAVSLKELFVSFGGGVWGCNEESCRKLQDHHIQFSVCRFADQIPCRRVCLRKVCFTRKEALWHSLSWAVESLDSIAFVEPSKSLTLQLCLSILLTAVGSSPSGWSKVPGQKKGSEGSGCQGRSRVRRAQTCTKNKTENILQRLCFSTSQSEVSWIW